MRKLILLIAFVSFSIQAQNITVSSGKSFTIEKAGSVQLYGDLTNNGTFTLNSDSDEFSSLLVSGAASGDIIYNRYVNIEGTGEWDLIGAPVSNMAFSSLITDANIATNGSDFAVGAYEIPQILGQTLPQQPQVI